MKYTIQVPESLCLCLLNWFCIWLLAEMPLDALKKQYAGAYADNFEWPHPSDEDDMEETEGAFVIEK